MPNDDSGAPEDHEEEDSKRLVDLTDSLQETQANNTVSSDVGSAGGGDPGGSSGGYY